MKALKRAVFITLFLTLCVLLFFVIFLKLKKWSDTLISSDELKKAKPSVSTAPVPPEQATEIVFVTGGDGSLDSCYLSELDCENIRWRLNVIPTDTRLMLSAELYKNLSKDNVTVPQLATLSELYRTLSEAAPEGCFMALAELLGFTPDSMLILPLPDFERVIRKTPKQYEYGGFLNDYFLEEISSQNGLWSFFNDYFRDRRSTLSLSDRLFYLETYESLTNLNISCRLVPGERHNNGYVVNVTLNDFYR